MKFGKLGSDELGLGERVPGSRECIHRLSLPFLRGRMAMDHDSKWQWTTILRRAYA
jgi:hypothetical protein